MHSDFSRVKNLFYRRGLFIHCQFEKVTALPCTPLRPPECRMAMSEDSIVCLRVDGRPDRRTTGQTDRTFLLRDG